MRRLSVLIPSYNSAPFISTAIDSALGQADVDVEVLVQDALSDDGTREILDAYGGDPRVRVVCESDSGVSDALNRLIRRSTGEMLVWLNADEFLLPGALRSAIALLEADASIDYVTGDPVFVDIDGRLLRRVSRFRPMRVVLRTKGSYPASCTLVGRRHVFDGHTFDETLRLVMDWDWYLRLSSMQLRGRHLARPMAAYRIHAGQLTHIESQSDWFQRRLLLRLQPEQIALRRRHGGGRSAPSVITYALLGDVLYSVLKLATGGYARDAAARSLVGSQLDWTRHSGALEALAGLGAR